MGSHQVQNGQGFAMGQDPAHHASHGTLTRVFLHRNAVEIGSRLVFLETEVCDADMSYTLKITMFSKILYDSTSIVFWVIQIPNKPYHIAVAGIIHNIIRVFQVLLRIAFTTIRSHIPLTLHLVATKMHQLGAKHCPKLVVHDSTVK